MWECSKDLAMYLHETTTTRTTASATSSSITTGSGRVLELGCGAALPGIAALCLGKCSRGAVFCDLNRSVLLETTWPSICMNVHHHILAKGDDPAAVCGPIRCFSGDWLQVSEQLLAEADELRCTLCHFTVLLARQTTYYLLSKRQDGAKFDLILAAEANYCAESSAKVGESLYVHQIILIPTQLCIVFTQLTAAADYSYAPGGRRRGARCFEAILLRLWVGRRQLPLAAATAIHGSCRGHSAVIGAAGAFL